VDILDCRVVPLADQYDIILGTTFLHEHNPDIDWQTGAIRIKGDPAMLLRGRPQPESKFEIISAHQLIKEHTRSGAVNLCHIRLKGEDDVDLSDFKGFPMEPSLAADFRQPRPVCEAHGAAATAAHRPQN
jgi:hypothetical protein